MSPIVSGHPPKTILSHSFFAKSYSNQQTHLLSKTTIHRNLSRPSGTSGISEAVRAGQRRTSISEVEAKTAAAESTTCNVLLSLPSPRIWWVWNKLRDLPRKSLGYNHGHGLKGTNSNGCHYISVALHQAPSTPQPSHHTQAVHEVPHSSTTAKRTNRFVVLKRANFHGFFVSCCLEKVGKQRFCLLFFVANGKVGSWKSRVFGSQLFFLFWCFFSVLRRCYFWKEAVILAPKWTVLCYFCSVFFLTFHIWEFWFWTWVLSSYLKNLQKTSLLAAWTSLNQGLSALANPLKNETTKASNVHPVIWWWFQLSNLFWIFTPIKRKWSILTC